MIINLFAALGGVLSGAALMAVILRTYRRHVEALAQHTRNEGESMLAMIQARHAAILEEQTQIGKRARAASDMLLVAQEVINSYGQIDDVDLWIKVQKAAARVNASQAE